MSPNNYMFNLCFAESRNVLIDFRKRVSRSNPG
jgi:hypothetical protein